MSPDAPPQGPPAGPAHIRCLEARGWMKGLNTRIPFRYGAANLVACPHFCVEFALEVDGKAVTGIAADNLPPGWFDKSGKPFAEQLADMLAAFRRAADAVLGRSGSGFSLWRDAFDHVFATGRKAGLPDLVLAFGASLVERALWDGLGRAKGLAFTELVRRDLFGVDWGSLDPALRGLDPGGFLPSRPLERVWARHTVGLSDPLEDGEIPAAERGTDGLPQSLEACLAAYGYRYLKIKLSNNYERDVERLRRIGAIMQRAESRQGAKILCTLDGNEQYKSVADLEGIVEALEKDPALRPFDGRVLFIEQPIERRAAFDPERTKGLDKLPYPVIIDESDAAFEDYRRALGAGYRGTSHKNCKGILKSLVNKARNHLAGEGAGLILSAEDLTNVGPVAVVQDLHVVASLGIEHVERNGHHYFRGLDHVSAATVDAVAQAHPGLFRREGGRATLAIDQGAIDCRGLAAPGLGGVPPRGEGWKPWEEFNIQAF